MLWPERMISIIKHVFVSFQAYAWTFASQQDCRCRLCCDAVRGLARLPGGGPGYPQLPRLKMPALMAFASCKPCSLQFSHKSGCLAARLMGGNHWKGVQIRKPRWYRCQWYPSRWIPFWVDIPVAMFLFACCQKTDQQTGGKWFGVQRIANLCRSLDQVATLPHSDGPIAISYFDILRPWILFMHHPLLFWVDRIFSWLVSSVENSFTAECYDLVVSANTSREGSLEGFVRG